MAREPLEVFLFASRGSHDLSRTPLVCQQSLRYSKRSHWLWTPSAANGQSGGALGKDGASPLASLVGPKSLKSIRCQGRITGSALEISMTKVVSQRSGVLSLVSKLVSR